MSGRDMHTAYGVTARGIVGDVAIRAWRRGVLGGVWLGVERKRRRTYDDVLV